MFFTDFWHSVKSTTHNVLHHVVKPVWETVKKALPAAKQIAMTVGMAIPALLPAAEAVVLGAEAGEAAIGISERIGQAVSEAIG